MSVFSRVAGWLRRNRAVVHLLLPAAVAGGLLAAYYSGVPALSAIVAPRVEGVHRFAWREFGALELTQLLLLAVLAAAAMRGALQRTDPGWLRALGLLLAALAAFQLLEEADYGRPYYEWLTGAPAALDPDTWSRNLHNLTLDDGRQLGTWLKEALDLAVIAWFFLLPLAWRGTRPAWLARLRPSRWFAASVVLAFALGQAARALERAGLGMFDGVPGPLADNASEFREWAMYWLLAWYTVDLFNPEQARHE